MKDQRWLRHLKRDIPQLAVIELVTVWEKLQDAVLTPGTQDSVTWRWIADGAYTAASAYDAQFIGATETAFISCIWDSDAPCAMPYFRLACCSRSVPNG
jgi:hypothetical protein